MKADKFKSKQVCELTGISNRQLIHWAERGVIIPDYENSNGRASSRVYSTRNLVQLTVIKELATFGFGMAKIKSNLRDMQVNKEGTCILESEFTSLAIDINKIKISVVAKVKQHILAEKRK